MEQIVQPREILKRALSSGARAAEVLYTHTEGLEAVVGNGRVKRRRDLKAESMTVMAWTGEGQVGRATGAPEAWESHVRTAVEQSTKGQPDPFAGPIKGWATADEGLGIDDRRYAQLTENEKMDVVLTAVRETQQAESRADTLDFSYRDGRTRRILANTKGVLLQEYGTTYEVKGGVTAAHLDLKLEGGLAGRTFAAVSSIPFGVLMANRMTRLMGETTELSGEVRVLLPPRVTASIFEFLAPHFTEESLSAGKTFLAKGFGKENLFDHRILMVDDGTLVGGLRTRSFDDRGAAPVPLTLIREGVIDRCFYSPSSARAKDTRATGHRLGTMDVPTNLQVRGGTRSLNALMAEMDQNVFFIDHLRDFEKGLNMKTGAISCRCSGIVMHKGTDLGVIRNARLKGNLVDCLQRLVSLSSDTDRYGHIDAPGMILDGLVLSP